MEPDARYDWDEHNEGHVAAHRVVPPEVEEVLANDPIHPVTRGVTDNIETRIDQRSGEKRVLELGHTNIGRILFAAWTPRGKLRRQVTAFDANRKPRATYLRRRNEEKQ